MAIPQAENTTSYDQWQHERAADFTHQAKMMYRHNVVFLDQNVLLFVDIVFRSNAVYYGW